MRIVMACLLALSLCSLPLSQAVAQTAPADATETKLAQARETITNVHYFESMLLGARTASEADGNGKGMSQADRERFDALYLEELEARRPAIIEAVAQGNVDRFTPDEWEQLARLSRIPYLQDLAMASADPSRPRPDPSTMSATDSAVFAQLITQPFVTRFFKEFDRSAATPQIFEAGISAMGRLQAR